MVRAAVSEPKNVQEPRLVSGMSVKGLTRYRVLCTTHGSCEASTIRAPEHDSRYTEALDFAMLRRMLISPIAVWN